MLPVRKTSSWDETQITNYLENTEQPLRLSLISDDAPLIVPLWFMFEAGVLWCACHQSAKLARLVDTQSHCGFDASDNTMPYRGVRGQGEVTIDKQRGASVLEELIERYLKTTNSDFARWLLSRRDEEVALAIRPRWITAWDFSARMPKA